ncbi:MAG TPA: hypothetical protein VE127_09440 [Solirubrobacteraceae bacterium]|nr:hypothetical protein [Solirubrobacteraceae bacterium]
MFEIRGPRSDFDHIGGWGRPGEASSTGGRPRREPQQLFRCYVNVAGDDDGEPHELGEWI